MLFISMSKILKTEDTSQIIFLKQSFNFVRFTSKYNRQKTISKILYLCFAGVNDQ